MICEILDDDLGVVGLDDLVPNPYVFLRVLQFLLEFFVFIFDLFC